MNVAVNFVSRDGEPEIYWLFPPIVLHVHVNTNVVKADVAERSSVLW
jgi:hypothetical protein